ncbi:MAG: hypothetical protein ABI557_18640, partial [Aureliella sp.]
MTTIYRGTARLPLALCCLLALVGSLSSPRLTAAQAPQQEQPPLPVEPETPEFKAATDAFREHLKKMREVLVHYNTTPSGPHDRQMRSEWNAYHREGLPLFQNMLDAAVAEYLMAPSEKTALAEMLWGIVDRNSKVDRYEGMLPIAQALLAGGYQNPELRTIAARTAYGMNDYVVMRQLATELIDEGVASPQLQRLSEEFDELEATWAEELAAREQDAQG